MTDIQVKQLTFLDETIKHYNSNNRAIIEGCCLYKSIPDVSSGCAIGRHLTPELATLLDSCTDLNSTSVEEDKIFNYLPDNLKELGQSFLNQVQQLHDNSAYWNEEGLTSAGYEKVRLIKMHYGLK